MRRAAYTLYLRRRQPPLPEHDPFEGDERGRNTELITHDEVTGLHLLTSSSPEPGRADRLRTDAPTYKDARSHLHARHHRLAPVSSSPTPCSPRPLVDGVLLVVHSGKTSRGVVRSTKQLLQDVGAKVFGVVLNNVNMRDHDYYYYRSYYSHYYSSEETTKEVASGAQA